MRRCSACWRAGSIAIPRSTPTSDSVARAVAVENKWRAQRYGVHGTFVGPNGAITVAEIIDQVIEETGEDAATLGCGAELERCRTIAGAGTSADAQLAVFHARGKTEGHAAALRR